MKEVLKRALFVPAIISYLIILVIHGIVSLITWVPFEMKVPHWISKNILGPYWKWIIKIYES